MSTIFKTAAGKYFVKMSRTEAKEVLARGGWTKTAMPVQTVQRVDVKMTSPSQWAFNVKVDPAGNLGPRIIVVFEPDVPSEKEISESDIRLNNKESKILSRATNLLAKKLGLQADIEFPSDVQYELRLDSAAFNEYVDKQNPGDDGSDFSRGLDEERFVGTAEEIKKVKSLLPAVQKGLSSMGFVFDKSVQFWDM